MRVGVLRIELLVPGARSLKAKRSPLKSLITRLRAKFNVAAAEVDTQDMHQRATLGLALVATDGVHLDQQIAAVEEFVANDPELALLSVARAVHGDP